jgi:hypothetical protein
MTDFEMWKIVKLVCLTQGLKFNTFKPPQLKLLVKFELFCNAMRERTKQNLNLSFARPFDGQKVIKHLPDHVRVHLTSGSVHSKKKKKFFQLGFHYQQVFLKQTSISFFGSQSRLYQLLRIKN